MVAAAPIQTARQLPLDMRERIDRTLVSMEVATHKLSVSEDEVLAMIQTGRIEWAWDIGRGAKRMELRIWRESLSDCIRTLEGRGKAFGGMLQAHVVSMAVPPPRPDALKNRLVNGVDLRHRFSCSEFLISQLIKEGELRAYGVTPNKHTPKIVYESILDFLSRRCL